MVKSNYLLVKRNIKEILIFLFFAGLLIILCLHPARYASAALDGLILFCLSVLPGLFPFMVLTKILSSLKATNALSKRLSPLTKKLFRSPGETSYALLLGSLSGCPVGAKIVGDMYKNNILSNSDAKKAVSFCMTSGPAFVLGTIGGIMFKNMTAGLIIFVSHIISNIITGMIITRLVGNKQKQSKHELSAFRRVENTQKIKSEPVSELLSNSLTQSIESILAVGGFISIFYALYQILVDLKIISFLSAPIKLILRTFGLPDGLSNGIMSGIIEVTRGVKELSSYFSISPIASVSLAAAIVSFSGLSIIFQSKALLGDLKIKTHFLIASKSVHACICFVVALILSCFLL